MNRKLNFIGAILSCGILGISEGRAALLSFPKPYIPQFYAGISLGVQRLTGHRNEYVDYTNTGVVVGAGIPGTEIISFSTQKGFSNNSGCYAAHVGFTWDIPQTLVFFGPEVYLGRGSTVNELKQDVPDLTGTHTSRYLTASVRQLTFWGGALQAGLNCPWNSKAYLLLGLETSQFEYSGTYIPRSQAALAGFMGAGLPITDYPSTILNARKWLRGFMWGLGWDKRINAVKIGFDVRIIQYRSLKTSQQALAYEPETLFSSFKPKNIRFSLKISYVF